jgi:hypothetical protein
MTCFQAYIATNTVTGLQYVGITRQGVFSRWKQHISDAMSRSTTLFHRAIFDHGVESFDVELVGEARNLRDLLDFEVQLIADRDTYLNGYNSTLGGEGGGCPRTVTVMGVEYPSFAEACRALGQSPVRVKIRLSKPWWSWEQAFGFGKPDIPVFVPEKKARPPKKPRVWKGIETVVAGKSFHSITSACKAHNLRRDVVAYRLEAGWTPEQAFGLEAAPPVVRGTPIEIDGTTYPSITAASVATGVLASTIHSRIKVGRHPLEKKRLGRPRGGYRSTSKAQLGLF